jgi:hypothetical protein
MIDAKELRIGNYVWFTDVPEKKDRHATVNAISEDCISTDKGMAIDEELKPIPLTEQWLTDFGFTTDEDSWFYSLELGDNVETFKICALYTNEVSTGSFTILNCRACIVHFKHVHQLQNLYFALTGKELTKQNNPL